jgi:DNA-binding transcriptional MerR regulator
MTGHGAKFGRKMEEAIAALLIQRNLEEAAKSAGVSPKTLRRWQQVPEFAAAYRKARRDAFAQSVARLQQVSGAAVTTLQRLIVDPNTPAAVKARAAYYILTLSTKAIETEDILARLDELERAAELNKCQRD